MKILLGVTGSVAATLTPKLTKALFEAGHKVEIVASQSSLYFFKPKEVGVQVWREMHEWPNEMYVKDEAIKHIELRDWAEVLLIAPLGANTLAKLANGYCDNLLTCVARAWHLDRPVIVAPAMNTKMWQHPVTAQHLATLESWYKLKVVPPVAKKLACGDEGVGAMAKIDDIVRTVEQSKAQN